MQMLKDSICTKGTEDQLPTDATPFLGRPTARKLRAQAIRLGLLLCGNERTQVVYIH